MKRERGTTLLELLIVVTLVSLLTVGMVYALRAGLGSMDATQRRIAVNRRTLGAARVLEQQVAGFMPVYAKCTVEGNPQGQRTPFFQGEPGVITFVTTYSLTEAARGRPRIVQMFVAPGANGLGVRLLVNEYPWNGPFGAGQMCGGPRPGQTDGPPLPRFRVAEQNPGSFVLADNLAAAQFVFQRDRKEREPDVWVPRWIFPEEWPRAIRLELMPLQADASRVQPVSLVLPVRVTRTAFEGMLTQ